MQSDTISSCHFIKDTLVTTCWDNKISFYSSPSVSLVKATDCGAPLLGSVVTPDESKVILASLNGTVQSFEIEKNHVSSLYSHTGPVSCVAYSSLHRSIISGSWDKSVIFGQENIIQVPQKVYKVDIHGHLMLVAMSNRMIHLYDLRNTGKPLQERESSLKFMTRDAKFLNGDSYATCSIEGRVAVDFVDPAPEWQSRKYAFKCHRQNVDGVDTVYPVNCLQVHPVYGTFSSAGSDGIVNIWDPVNKKRIKQFPKFGNAVSAVAFSSDGERMAVCASYTFEHGAIENPGDSTVELINLTESDVKPKEKK